MFLLRKKSNLIKIALVIVLLIFFFLRFYLIQQRLLFGWDQARDAQVVSQVLSGKPTLIGPRVLGPDKFFLGPYFYYLLTPFYLITRGSPTAMIWFLICYNLMFVGLFWLIIKKTFFTKAAFFSLLLWALNPSFIKNDIISWNPVLVPLIVIITWYWCYLALKRENGFIWLLLGLTLGLGVNFHFQIIFLICFVVLFFWLNKQVLSLKKVFLSMVGFLVSFSPLFLFDLRHNFLNSQLLIKFFTAQQTNKEAMAWLPVLNNFVQGFTGISLSPVLILTFFLLFTAALFVKGKKSQQSLIGSFYQASAGLFIVSLIGFSYYGVRPSEYYFNYLAPFIIVFLTSLLSKRNWGQVLLVTIGLFWFGISLNKINPIPFSLINKTSAVKYLTQRFNQEKVNVAFSVPLSEDTSYIYLIEQAGYKIDSSAGPQYTIVVPPEKEEITVIIAGIGLVLPEEE